MENHVNYLQVLYLRWDMEKQGNRAVLSGTVERRGGASAGETDHAERERQCERTGLCNLPFCVIENICRTHPIR